MCDCGLDEKIEARIRYHWEVYRECDDKLAITVMAIIVELKNLLPKNKEKPNDRNKSLAKSKYGQAYD